MVYNIDEDSKGFEMEINPNIRVAAIEVVRTQLVEDRMEVPGYAGIFVALATDQTIQSMTFFTEGEVGYVIGPLRK